MSTTYLNNKRANESDQDEESDEEFVPYIPVKKRKEEELNRLKNLLANNQINDVQSSNDQSTEIKTTVNSKDDLYSRNMKLSLLDQHNELKKKAEQLKESELEKRIKEEENILKMITEKKALMGVKELGK